MTMKYEWNVFREALNQNKMEVFNIFDHYAFMNDVKKAYTKYKKSKNFDEFYDKVKSSLRYNFWAKCEWEIILSDWPPSKNFNDKKVDVYTQVMINEPLFRQYLFNAFPIQVDTPTLW